MSEASRHISGIGRKLQELTSHNAFAVIAITASVQGLVIGSQFLVAFVVGPEELGAIRWLESALAILLLVASCGMPAVVFREATLAKSSAARTDLFLRAIRPTIVAGVLIASLSWAAYAITSVDPTGRAGYSLLIAVGILLPANVARVGIALIQGAQDANRHWRSLVAIAALGAVAFAGAASFFGLYGWIGARYCGEAALALFVLWRLGAVRRGTGTESPGYSWSFLLRAGLAANWALTIRLICDNLPMLLLKLDNAHPKEVGWFAFANLLMFLPMLLMSVMTQVNLPQLVAAHREPAIFRTLLARTRKGLLACALLGAVGLAVVAAVAHLGREWAYSEAAFAIVLLALTLPVRAYILAINCALVAHGKYAVSSIITLVEIAVVALTVVFSGVQSSTAMAALVLAAAAASLTVAVALNQKDSRLE